MTKSKLPETTSAANCINARLSDTDDMKSQQALHDDDKWLDDLLAQSKGPELPLYIENAVMQHIRANPKLTYKTQLQNSLRNFCKKPFLPLLTSVACGCCLALLVGLIQTPALTPAEEYVLYTSAELATLL
ncbi:hypothetical protein [Arsukibacterium sp.]|uniref:hypothetical protein n=1 Tax=Arsukibacterium sp. TaxID=1977258 RepID=UPI0035634E35